MWGNYFLLLSRQLVVYSASDQPFDLAAGVVVRTPPRTFSQAT